MDKNILITGSSGFIGKYLVEKYIKKGFEVYGISSIQNQTLKKNNFLKKTYNKRRVINFLKKSNIKYVIFSHGSINHSSSYEEVYKDHFLFTKLIIDCLNKDILKKIIFFSSGDEYGFPLKKIPIIESTICRPNSNYAVIKNLSTNYLINYFKNNQNISVYILRLFLIYGETQKKPRLIPNLKYHIKKDKEFLVSSINQIKDFTHISDLYYYINKFIDSNEIIQDIFNFGSKNRFSIKKIITLVEKKNNKKLRLKFTKIKLNNSYSSYPSIRKLEMTFGKKEFHKLNSKNI